MERSLPSEPADRLRDVLDSWVDRQDWCCGAQLSVGLRTGQPLSLAVGTNWPGVPLSTDHRFGVWCALRPLVSMTLLQLLEEHDISAGSAVRDVLADDGVRGHLTWRSVLDHSAGLDQPRMLRARMLPVDRAIEEARTLAVRGGRAYSEFAAPVLIADAIAVLSGGSSTAAVQRTIDHLSLADHVKVTWTEAELTAPLSTFGISWCRGRRGLIPSLGDTLPAVAGTRRDLYGLYTSAHGMCRFYQELGRALDGEARAGLPSGAYLATYLDAGRGPEYDPVLGRACSFAAGLMTGLSSHGIASRLSDRAVGHTGVGGSPVGFLDRDAGLALALIINGLPASAHETDDARRELVDEILAEVTAGQVIIT